MTNIQVLFFLVLWRSEECKGSISNWTVPKLFGGNCYIADEVNLITVVTNGNYYYQYY